MSSNDVPIYASRLSNDKTTNEHLKDKGPQKIPPEPSDFILVHESPVENSSKKRKSTDNIMDTNIICETSGAFVKEKWKDCSKRYYSKKRRKGRRVS
jgi:hypothetical protein